MRVDHLFEMIPMIRGYAREVILVLLKTEPGSRNTAQLKGE